MEPPRSLASVVGELVTVLLITGAAFMWGKDVAMAERGYKAIGGEYLILLFPMFYYIGKQMIWDWLACLEESRQDDDDS